jgi:hypothetical protein
MYLFKVLWVIEINYQTILSFILGIFIGFILLLLIYAILVLKSVRDVKLIKVNPTDTMTEQEAKALIEQAIIDFKDKTKRGKNSKGTHFRILVQDLVYGIAASFFPKSKYPLAEISISEAILLLQYIQKRLDEILDRKGVRILKKFKISTIIDISMNTKKVTEAKAFKVTKRAAKVTGVVTKVINVINPVNLFRKLVVETTLSKVTNKLYMISLSIVGEEAFKIYSKAVLKEELQIDSNVDELVDSLKEDFEDAKVEASGELNLDKKDENRKFKTMNLVMNSNNETRKLEYDQTQKFRELKKVEEN